MAEIKLLVHGSLSSDLSASELELKLPSGVSVVRKHQVELQRARADKPPHLLTADENDLVELELSSGIKLWTSVRLLKEDEGRLASRSAAGDVVELPHTLHLSSASRGAAEWIIKGLRVLGLDIAGEITSFISSHVEGKLSPPPGLYRCNASSARDLTRLQGKKARSGQPALIFLHGTASSTEGSFAGLWEGGANSVIGRLLQVYGDQVFAFQHRTLSLSPIENTLDLVKELPTGTRLHLVSHSRGGMIGELLCRAMREGRAAFDDVDFDLFSAPERQRDLDALRELARQIEQRQLRIERFVRVACPARGTTLADGRLDRYLSIVLNLLSLTGLKASPIFDAVSTLLAGIIHKRTDPHELPGLEAMMPTSPLVTLLNRADILTEADLHVLGGDIEGGSILERLKVLATDIYYREDHDLVVNTPSMFGGADREKPVRYWIDQGARVDHFSYFRNTDTAERLVQALSDPETDSFHTVDKTPREITESDYRKRAVGPQPVVFVIPGIMGTQLKVKNDRIWMDLFSLARGGMGRIAIGQRGVEPDQPLDNGYGDLIRFLAQTHEVIPFGYDWRDSLEKSAERLRSAIESKLAETESANEPIRIIAHSMGGLVVRTMISDPAGRKTWERLCKRPGMRFLMLGTPNGGSHSIAAMLMGRDPLVRKLAMIDLKHDFSSLLGIICAFPGVIQLLPYSEGDGLDLFLASSWEKIRSLDVENLRGLFSSKPDPAKSSGISWASPAEALLKQARELHNQWRQNRLDPAQVVYVAGAAPATPVAVLLRETEPPGRRVVVEATEHGDGRVPWETGIPPELKGREFYMDVTHGDMAANAEAFSALLELLETGKTGQLSQTPPVRRSASNERFVLPPEMPAMYPDQQDLVASALGGTIRKRRRAQRTKVRVKVVHGDLSQATSAVVAGHYLGDTIVSAEDYLDRCLRGQLRQRQNLGLYPGPLHSTEVFLDRSNQNQARRSHPGAVIIGLGQFGDLTPGDLTEAFARGTLKYAAEMLEQESGNDASNAPAQVAVALTSLLIGTGAGGFGVGDTLQAMLRGVQRANGRIEAATASSTPDASSSGSRKSDTAATGRSSRIRISELTIIELYEDRAIQAARALEELGRSSEFRETFEIEPVPVQGEGGLRRVVFQESASWWQRVRIEAQKDGSLKFEAFGDRARTESFLQPTQRRLVDSFLRDAIGSTATDLDLSSTLFELFVPNRIKDMAPDNRDVVLLLDAQAAAYPWELMRNRWEIEGAPLAVKAGMIRQLTVEVFRQHPASGLEERALVIGDPANNDRRFVPLPGAQEEARQVAQELRSAGYSAELLVGNDATPRSVLSALHAQRYRILHFAAHGVVDFELDQSDTEEGASGERSPKPVKVTGMALGDGAFLTAAEIEQMRNVPDLVFINCCHLGQTRNEVPYHRLAANLATQLIRMGVRAVIAAGWPVDDGAAQTFAQSFYRNFLSGFAFGEAVRLARQETYVRHPQANTWGAYQCYGEPGFSLRYSPSAAARKRPPALSAPEVKAELENLLGAFKTASPARKKELENELVTRAAELPARYLKSAAIRSALGRAFAETGRFEEAIAHYESTKFLDQADAPLNAIEQLANLRGRLARTLAASNATRAKALFKQAENDLNLLLQIGETPERLNLRGSLFKRRAMCAASVKDVTRFSSESARSYQRAYNLAADPRSPYYNLAPFYSLQNWLTMSVPVLWIGTSKKHLDEFEAGLAEMQKLADTLLQQQPGTWSFLSSADVALLREMSHQRLQDPTAIASLYREANLRSGSERTLQSALDQIDFFRQITTRLLPKKAKLRSDLDALYAALREKPG